MNKLGDIVSAITVGHVGPMTTEYRSSGIPFLRSQNVRRFRIDTEGLCYIGESFHSTLSKSRLSPGDVVVVRTGDPGTAAVIPDWLPDANCADLVIIRPGATNPRFISYYINSVASGRIADVVVGAVQQHFNVGAARELRIPTPPRSVQDAVASVLGALDDKIALNRRMNQTLEALGSELFASWFVELAPVAAKRDGRTPFGVPVDAIDLFPSHFEDSELGPIPQGWRIVPLDSVADFLNGLALQRYPPRDGDVLPVIKIAELRAGNTVGADLCSGVPQEYIIDDGDVIFSWSGSLLVDVWCGGKGALNQHLFKVTSREVPKWFYLAWLNEHLPEFQAIAADKATTMGHIRRFHLTEAKVLVPPEPLLKAMTSVQQPLVDQIIHNRLESRTLAELRDTLLGPLLSGELTIKAAETTVGAAL